MARHDKPPAREDKYPIWFTDPLKQHISEILAHNVAIDFLLHVEPSIARWPYSEFRAEAVEAFLAHLSEIGWPENAHELSGCRVLPTELYESINYGNTED